MNRYPGLLSPREVQAMCLASTRVGVVGDDLLDVLQDAALHLWQAGLAGGGAAYNAARNAAVEMQRARFGRHTRRQYRELQDHEAPGPDDASGGAAVREALDTLPEQDREHAEALMTDAEGARASAVWRHTARLRAALAACL